MRKKSEQERGHFLSRSPKASVLKLGLWLLLGFACHTLFAGREVFRVAVAPQEIVFRWDETIGGGITICELPLEAAPEANGLSTWTGSGALRELRIERFNSGRDRMFSKYRIEVEGNKTTPTAPQFVTDFESLVRREAKAGSPISKKGIACLLDSADGRDLGFAQVNQNIDIGGLLDTQSASPKMSFEYEGRTVGLKPGAVQSLDRALREAFAAGQRVTGILLNYVSSKTPRESPLVHPLTDPLVVPIGPSAFNTATSEGVFYYRAILYWLVERYTREDAAFGRLGGLVIGNEMQSHWSWYHLGLVEADVVIREYSAALRIADLVTRSLHANFPIYVSLDHHWRLSASEDARKGFSAVEALEGINEIAKRGGDFPWNVAFHPYPENLLNPVFWKDQSAPLRFDAPRVTFHNLEVLPAYLQQQSFLFNGRERRVTLTEQGFHCPESPDGERLQAAAYAYAWKKVQALPGIESLLYHRHVDHPHEHGLRCGIREHDGSANVNGIGRKRMIWEIVRSAGTEAEDAAFAFALPIVGRVDWSNVVSTQFEAPRSVKIDKQRVVYDFVLHLKEAVAENTQVVEKRKIGPRDEVQETAILEHPRAVGRGLLKFSVQIPEGEMEGKKAYPVLKFDALLNSEKSSGAGFYVEVNGENIFSRVLRGGERVPTELDLSRWAGQNVLLVFGVDAAGDPSYDSATWVSPAIVYRDY
jgi:hypothetical protein